ncbi:MAG: hypothetical protein AAFN93_25665, partial [Bacteroidota bacterium]
MTETDWKKYEDMPIEDIIKSSYNDPLKEIERLQLLLSNSGLDGDTYKVISSKLVFAINRIEEHLEPSLAVLYILLPFGITSAFTPDIVADIDKFRKLGYLRKIKGYYISSVIGAMMYF